MNELTIFGDKPLTKANIEQAGEAFAKQLLDAGDQSPLDALIKLRALEAAIARAIEELKVDATFEAEQYSRNDRKRFGVSFQVRNGRTFYSYDHDTEWQEANAAEKAAAEKRKRREKFLKALKKSLADTETGEMIDPAKITGYSGDTLAIYFPKE